MTEKIDIAVVKGILKERRKDSHKGTYGHLLLSVGSKGYRGAAVLAALGAYYTGVGLVTVASTEKVLSLVVSRLPEAILLDIDGDLDNYLLRLADVDACLIGCGLSRSSKAKDLLYTTIKHANCPLVIDADGLNILSFEQDLLKEAKSDIIITPHIGEFSRLSSCGVEDILANRAQYAADYAVVHGVYVVLKSDKTVIALPDGTTYINTAGNSSLAKAGSGDLLAGVIAAALAMKYSTSDAAIAGTYLHSLAADLAVIDRNPHSVTASFVAEYISDAYNYIFSTENE